jgi:uncharacterized protein YlxW (UPF0749 family)
MSLLVDLMNRDALDEGYALAAARRGPAGPRARTPWRSAGSGLALASAGLLLALGAHSLGEHAPAAVRAKATLRADVRSRTASTDRLAARIERLRLQTDRTRNAALAATATGDRAARHLEAAELGAGALPVSGPGLRVVLDDAPAAAEPDTAGPVGLGTVLDTDLAGVVNALWASGAEAIAVSGQRLSTLSAIRSAGSAILVDFRPVPKPYVVLAIGAPARLQRGFTASTSARTLGRLADAVGLRFTVGTAASITLPAAPGLVLRHAHPGGQR